MDDREPSGDCSSPKKLPKLQFAEEPDQKQSEDSEYDSDETLSLLSSKSPIFGPAKKPILAEWQSPSLFSSSSSSTSAPSTPQSNSFSPSNASSSPWFESRSGEYHSYETLRKHSSKSLLFGPAKKLIVMDRQSPSLFSSNSKSISEPATPQFQKPSATSTVAPPCLSCSVCTSSQLLKLSSPKPVSSLQLTGSAANLPVSFNFGKGPFTSSGQLMLESSQGNSSTQSSNPPSSLDLSCSITAADLPANFGQAQFSSSGQLVLQSFQRSSCENCGLLNLSTATMCSACLEIEGYCKEHPPPPLSPKPSPLPWQLPPALRYTEFPQAQDPNDPMFWSEAS